VKWQCCFLSVSNRLCSDWDMTDINTSWFFLCILDPILGPRVGICDGLEVSCHNFGVPIDVN
jgi:hypothetical protein